MEKEAQPEYYRVATNRCVQIGEKKRLNVS